MKKDITLFRLSVLCLFVSSFSILLTFIGNYEGDLFNVIFAVLTGVLFWGGLAAGYAILFVVNRHRKRFEASRGVKNSRVGVLKFFSNKWAKIIDVWLIFMFLLNLVIMFVPVAGQAVQVVTIVLLIFLIHMHSLFNGINFTYIQFLSSKESRR